MSRKLKDADRIVLCRTRTIIRSLHKYFRSQDAVISEVDLLLKTAAATGVSMKSLQNMKKLAKQGTVPAENSTLQKVEYIWSTRKLSRRTRKVVLNIHKFFRSQDEVISETDLLLKTAAVTGVSLRTIQNIKKQFREEAKREMKVTEEVEPLSEPDLECGEDAELEEVLPAVKEKVSIPDSDNPKASEVKQDCDERESMEIKEEPIIIKTEPPDDEHRDEKCHAEAASWTPEAKKSKLNFEKVWVKVEHDQGESLDAHEDEKSRSDFENVWVKSECDKDKDSDALEDCKIEQQDFSQDCIHTESILEEPELEVQSTQPTPDPLLFQPTPHPLPVQTTSGVHWMQPTPQPLFVHPPLKVNTTQPTQQPLAVQPTLVMHSTQPTPQALSIQPTLKVLSTQSMLQPLSFQPTVNVLSSQPAPQPLNIQPALSVLSSQPTQPVLTQPAFFQVVNVLPIAPTLSLDTAMAPSHFPGYSNVIIQVKPQTGDVASPLPSSNPDIKSLKPNSKAPKSNKILKLKTMTEGSDEFETVLVKKEKGYEELRTNVTTDEQACKWLLEYSRENHVNFNVMTKFNGGGKYLSLHWKFVCSYGDKHHKESTKIYTGCEVILVMQVQSLLKKSTEEDEFRMKYPCKITITGEHNHVLEYAEALN